MSGGTIVVIVVVVIALLAAIGGIALAARRRSLQRQFGPEYERVVAEQNSRIRAEAELAERQRRVRKLDIKPLSEASAQQYSARWVAVQEHFVDAPNQAVAEAYDLVTTVMTDRGYPIEDDDQMQADLSVEHAATVSQFRSARAITSAAAAGDAETEELRQALIDYRALFADLLGEPGSALGAQNGTTTTAAEPTDQTAGGTAVDTPAYEQQRR